MDDCNEFSLLGLEAFNRSDSSMDDCNADDGLYFEENTNKFRFLYGRL